MTGCHSSYREPHCAYGPRRPSSTRVLWRLRGTDLAGVYIYNVILLLYFVPYLVSFLLYLNITLGTMADCHFFYREPHCRPPKVAPTLAFWGAYTAGARERDGRLPGIGPSRKWGALKRLREGGYVREFARRARWPFAMRSAKAATRDGRLPGTRPARWPFARHPASEMAVCQASGQL